MNILLKIINNGTLILSDNEGNVLAQHKPFWTRFEQFKRVKENCNIVKEDDEGFPKDISKKANIYCLDDKFELRWTIDAPFENDSFPNKIVWDKKTVSQEAPNGHLILDITESATTFICSSLKGITVTVDYDTGKTVTSEFTK